VIAGAPMQPLQTARTAEPVAPADARAHWPRRRAPVRVTVLPHAAHVSAWVRETATERAVTQMFRDFDMTSTDASTDASTDEETIK
jgi:hypothetical protein